MGPTGLRRIWPPSSPYHSTEEASFLSGAVFTVTGNGRVTRYFDPEPTAEIKKDGAPWNVDELIETMPLPCSRTSSPRRRATMGMLFAVRGDRADQHTAVGGTPPETRRAAGPTTSVGPPHVSATGGRSGQACWLAIPRYSPRRYSRSGPAWAASAPKPAARERKPGSVSECANSP
jgi:hypothetical protein